MRMLSAGIPYKTIIDSTKVKRKDKAGYDIVSSFTLAKLAKRIKENGLDGRGLTTSLGSKIGPDSKDTLYPRGS